MRSQRALGLGLSFVRRVHQHGGRLAVQSRGWPQAPLRHLILIIAITPLSNARNSLCRNSFTCGLDGLDNLVPPRLDRILNPTRRQKCI
jgi:signal transduction histidine kinase